MQLSNPATVEIAQIATWDRSRWGSRWGIVLFSLLLSGHHYGILNWKDLPNHMVYASAIRFGEAMLLVQRRPWGFWCQNWVQILDLGQVH